MRIVALEEHFVTPAVLKAWAALPTAEYDRTAEFGRGEISEQLLDVDAARLAAMDDMGVDVQVLSLNAPGLQNVPAAQAPALAREANDALAVAIARHPDRLQGFAAVPTAAPEAAADEVRRAITALGLQGVLINGRTGSRHLDDSALDPIWRVCAELGAPVYLHPQVPTASVREAYYTGLGQRLDVGLSQYGMGWHYETGLELLRLIYGATFDRFPDLQVVVGHWGEMVLFFEERARMLDHMGRALERPLPEYLRGNVSYTGSGIASHRYLRWAIEVVGIDRILYATDYPFIVAPNGGSRTFLEEADLSVGERGKIAYGNWETLTAKTRPAGGSSSAIGRPTVAQ